MARRKATYFTPDQITGLHLWLKADSLSLNDGDAIATWSDSSGNGHDGTQGTGSRQPTFKTGIINGKPVVRCDGGDSLVIANTASHDLATYSIFVVAARASGTGLIMGKSTTSFTDGRRRKFNLSFSSNTNLRYGAGADGTQIDETIASSLSFNIVGVITRGNSDHDMIDNGVATTSATALNDSDFNSAALCVCSGFGQAAENFTGDIAEIIMINRPVNSEESLGIQNYLAAKYNLGNTTLGASPRTVSDSIVGFKSAAFSYVGDGVDDRSIAVGFKPDLVIIKSQGSNAAVFRTSLMTGDDTALFVSAGANITNAIQSFTANGFTIGTDSRVNTSGTTYHVMAFKKSSNTASKDFEVFQYTGNGTSQDITTGFQPDFVWVKRNNASNSVRIRMSAMTGQNSMPFTGGGTVETNSITALISTGFSIGSNGAVNTSGNTYNGFAFRAIANNGFVSGSFTGDGTDNRNITGLGFEPAMVMVRDLTDVAGDNGICKMSTFVGEGSSGMEGAAPTTTNLIQYLISDGFQVGSSEITNGNTDSMAYVAFKLKQARAVMSGRAIGD